MELLTGVFTAFGLSASAGLNAYIPLLVVGLLARYTDLIRLKEPWDTLSDPWIILLLCGLVIIEMVADKVPAVNHINDLIQTVVRPVAGAIMFAASDRYQPHPCAGMRNPGGRHGTRCQVWGTSSRHHSHYRRRRECPRIHCGGYRLNRIIHIGDHPASHSRRIFDHHRRAGHLLAVQTRQQNNYLI